MRCASLDCDGHANMRREMQGLALLVQQGAKRNPQGDNLFVFRGRPGRS